MKKIVNLKEMFIILIALALIVITTNVFATDGLVIGENTNTNSGVTTITGNEYEDAQNISVEGNNTANQIGNNSAGNNSTGNNSTGNNVKKYNTVDKEDKIPQTGIEDYNIGILLIICVASAIFAYKKINDYKNI